MLDTTTLFVKIDDFYQIFQPSYVKYLRDHHLMQRQRKGQAKTGKTSMGWFHGYKLHLIINECGELLAFAITQS